LPEVPLTPQRGHNFFNIQKVDGIKKNSKVAIGGQGSMLLEKLLRKLKRARL